MKKTHATIAISSLLTLLAIPAWASQSYYQSAQGCWASSVAQVTNKSVITSEGSLGTNIEGIELCAMNWAYSTAATVIDSVSVTYDDEDANTVGNTAPYGFTACFVAEVNWNGMQYSSGTLYTTPQHSPGYSSSDSTNSGDRGLGTMVFTSPISVTNQYPVNSVIECANYLSTQVNATQAITGYFFTLN